MRLLVLSDSHRDAISLQMAVDSNPDADAVIFLGDGASDFDKVKDKIAHKRIIAVKGNCDGYYCPYPEKAVEELGGAVVYCTHGYAEHVKFGLGELKEKARSHGAKIVLYGHTHTPYTDYEDGLYIMNPGSVFENSCGIVDITPTGIICFTKKIVT